MQGDTWWSAADVVNGVAYEGGSVTGQGKAYKVETKMFKTADATPALNTALQTMRACKNQVGLAVRKTFIIVEPDGIPNSATATCCTWSPSKGARKTARA